MSRTGSSSGSLPTRVGPYRIERKLGSGGMGAVFGARHERTGAVRAVKVIHAEALGEDAAFALERFAREVETLARISDHAGIVRIHDSGTTVSGAPWYAMDCVDGRALCELIERRELAPADAARVVAEVARAIEHAHAAGVIHRDLKPSNVLVDRDGRARLLDFGLAHDLRAARLTRTGEVLGTPAYLAPEAVAAMMRGERAPAGAAIDVYGLGAVLYAALTRRPPFEGPMQKVLADLLERAPEPPRRVDPAVAEELDAICRRAMDRQPGLRYPSAAAMARDLERWLRGEPIDTQAPGSVTRAAERLAPLRRPAKVAAALALAVLVVFVAAHGIAAALRPAPPLDVDGLIAELAARRGRLTDLERERIERATLAAVGDDQVRGLRLLLLRDELDANDAAVARRARDELKTALRVPAKAAGVQRVLAAGGRLDALYELLHPAGEAPLPAAPSVAAALARHIVERGLAVPRDPAAFAALHDADGLERATRSGLLLARARRALAEGRVEEAAADLVVAHRLHGATPARADWTDELAAACRALARESALSDRESRRPTDARTAWAATDLLAAVEGHPFGIPPDLVVWAMERFRAFHGDFMHSMQERRGADGLVGCVEVCAFLDRYGWSPLALSAGTGIELIGDRAVLRRLVGEIGEREAARPAAERHPALLLGLAYLVVQLGEEGAEAPTARAWIAAAEQVEPEAERDWFLYQRARVLLALGDRERGLADARRARARLDWPEIEMTLAYSHLPPRAEPPDPAEGARRALAAVAAIERIFAEAPRALRADPDQNWGREQRLLYDATSLLVSCAEQVLPEPEPNGLCCDGEVGIEALLLSARRLSESFRPQAEIPRRAHDIGRAEIAVGLAGHHLAHERNRQAGDAVAVAIDALEPLARVIDSGDLRLSHAPSVVQAGLVLARAHFTRAVALFRLGDRAAAEAARARARDLQARLERLFPELSARPR